MQIEEAIQDYLYYSKWVDKKSINTISSYQNELKKYAYYLDLEGIYDTSDITYFVIYDYLHSLLETMKRTSVNHALSTIKQFHTYLSMTYSTINNPTLHLKAFKSTKALPKYFNHDDIKYLLESFSESDKDIFEKAVLELLYGCGLRVSELCHLQYSDLHLQNHVLRIHGKGNKQRMIPIHQRCIEALMHYLEQVRPKRLKKQTEYLFLNEHGKMLQRGSVHTLIKKNLKKCGLNEALSAHSFRHSFASHLLDGGADLRSVQELLGHADITTTQIYTHIQNKRLCEQYTQKHPRCQEEEDEQI